MAYGSAPSAGAEMPDTGVWVGTSDWGLLGTRVGLLVALRLVARDEGAALRVYQRAV